MSFPSTCPGTDIKAIRQNFDLSNPTVAEIIRIKEQRLKILQELNQQQEYKEDEITNFSRHELTRAEITRPPNDYGPVPGVEVGCHWETRMECSMYGVHRPTVAGIHGGPKGAYSIALSGGYPEDVDEGDSFIYTGAGGRDLKGTAAKPKNLRIAPQTKDQQLEGTNLSLVKSIKSKLPIRVIRGYKSPSIFAPETGYRYDGLYQVVKYWEGVGKTGYRVYRFKMERMKNQAPPPWERSTETQSFRETRTKDQNNFQNEECKENISFDEKGYTNNSLKHVSCQEVSNLDDEIEICVKVFCKTTITDQMNAIEKFEEATDFLGWDH